MAKKDKSNINWQEAALVGIGLVSTLTLVKVLMNGRSPNNGNGHAPNGNGGPYRRRIPMMPPGGMMPPGAMPVPPQGMLPGPPEPQIDPSQIPPGGVPFTGSPNPMAYGGQPQTLHMPTIYNTTAQVPGNTIGRQINPVHYDEYGNPVAGQDPTGLGIHAPGHRIRMQGGLHG